MTQPISMVRGTTKTIRVSLVNTSGDAYQLGEGEVLRLGIKRRPEDTDLLVSKELTAPDASGEYIFKLDASDTATMQFGMYYYDVGLESGGNYIIVVECSPIQIKYNISQIGGGNG